MTHAPLFLSWKKHVLRFRGPAKTSYTTFHERAVWYVTLTSPETGKQGTGECAPLAGLSIESAEEVETKLQELTKNPEASLEGFPSLAFALECARLDLKNNSRQILFPSEFTQGLKGIRINGLIWMAPFEIMLQQLEQKMAAGFKCIKLKVGGIDFSRELELLQTVRDRFSESQLELRVDANGAFNAADADDKLGQLARFNLHSIEQPVKPGQPELLKRLCRESPVPVALDEELLPRYAGNDRDQRILDARPQFLVLKPSLLGGFKASERLMALARENGIGYWVTSALESNTGLNALAQWVYACGLQNGCQGLGTGELYENNVPSPLELRGETLYYVPER